MHSACLKKGFVFYIQIFDCTAPIEDSDTMAQNKGEEAFDVVIVGAGPAG